MAVKTAQYIFNGQAYNLTYNSTSGKWEATVTAPSKSSYNQPDHVLGGTVKATDEAGNTTTVDQSHATLGASLKLRVKEKTAPTITITSPSAGAYITNTTPTIEFQVKDTDSGVNAGTIAVTVDGTAVSTVTKTAIDGGYKCTCTSPTLKDDHIRFRSRHPTTMVMQLQLRQQHLQLIQCLRHCRSWLHQMAL